MKITKTDEANIQLIQQYQKSDRVKGEADQKVLGNAPPEEKVNLSSAARDIQSLQNAISQLPEVRTEKVQDLQKQIDEKTYKVDSDKVAQKMAGESLLDIFA